MADYILLMETSSRLNLMDFQSGFDWGSISKILVAGQRKRGYSLITSVIIEFTGVEPIYGI